MLVILESPYAGDIERNIRYARACLRHSLSLGESPFASHLLYTQPGVLDDTNLIERNVGIEAGLRFLHVVQKSVVYTDLGISSGMATGINRAMCFGVPVVYRKLPGWVG